VISACGDQGEGFDWIRLAHERNWCASSCERCNEPSSFMKGMKFLDWLKDRLPSQRLLHILLLLLWLYSPLFGLGRFSSILIYTQSVGLLGRGISPSQSRYIQIGQHKHRINLHRNPCLEWDSNPRSQHLSERRQTARPL
jgi:hypothetical protein